MKAVVLHLPRSALLRSSSVIWSRTPCPACLSVEEDHDTSRPSRPHPVLPRSDLGETRAPSTRREAARVFSCTL